MAMPARPIYYTADMVRELPDDGNRYETVHGELLVTPAPRLPHQGVLGRLHLLLGNYLAAEGIGGLYFSPADISWTPDTLVQPDLFVAAAEEVKTQDWAAIRTLYLAIEVLSPSSVRADRFTKRRLYQQQGIPQYWIIDIEERQVEVWTPDAIFPVVERERLTWRHPTAKGECVVEVAALFAEP
jgi:Uma2 family endonuclease